MKKEHLYELTSTFEVHTQTTEMGWNSGWLVIYSICWVMPNGAISPWPSAKLKLPVKSLVTPFSIILKAKDFATEITIFNAKSHGMETESAISNEHITNNKAVRNTLIERGIHLENLPPAEDVKKVAHRLKSEEKKSPNKPDVLDSDG